MKIRRCVDFKDPRSVFNAKTSCVIALPRRLGNQQAVEKLDGRINSHHQDSFQYLLFNTRSTGALEGCTKASKKTDEVSRFPFAFLGALVVRFSFLSVLAAFSGNFNYLLHWRLRSENYSPYSVANDRHVEINKKPETFAAKFQIGQKLSLEQWQEFLDCLEFNNDLVIDQQVQSQPAINSYVVVCDWQDYLGLKVNFAFVQFVTQTLLVD
jgi:hypothetical protein